MITSSSEAEERLVTKETSAQERCGEGVCVEKRSKLGKTFENSGVARAALALFPGREGAKMRKA